MFYSNKTVLDHFSLARYARTLQTHSGLRRSDIYFILYHRFSKLSNINRHCHPGTGQALRCRAHE